MYNTSVTAVGRAFEENSALLEYPGRFTRKTGTVLGVDVWGPAKHFRKQKHTESTRVCKLKVNAPASHIEDLWVRQHGQRARWEPRTCAGCNVLARFDENGKQVEIAARTPANAPSVVWYQAQSKPGISSRDFVYAMSKVKTVGKTHYYAGGSLAEPLKTQKKSKCVRAFLEGVVKVQELNGLQQCEVTYLLRCRPGGLLPQLLIDAVANELVFTAFDLKTEAEKTWSNRSEHMPGPARL